MDTPTPRSALNSVPAYVPGRPPAPREGLTVYKVSSNENPNPPLPSVLEVIREQAAGINRYPDMGVTELTDALASHLGVPRGQLATGTGSVGVLGQIIQAMCEAGDEVVHPWRSFEAYPIVVALSGATAVPVPLTAEHRHDLDAMAAAITDRTKVVLVCTPNNPTGPALTHAELEDFVARVPRHVLVVVDEAYLEFVEGEERVDGLALRREHPNVALLRTFSKAYGLAGLRVGYAVAAEELAEALRKAATPFGVNLLAQAAAVASLAAKDELDVRVKELVGERARVVSALADAGWELPETQANFVWFPLGERIPDFVAACEEAGLSVRPYGTDGVRVTIGETEANDRLIEVASAFGR
ncbi:histidinol-phosphate transaminase [Janibacter corallicola]|uniref:histidinol-phosphate transaminase n=1 Tax=Janibacter corallicola TaxID=415212 RepID=UPI000834F8BB|nr:histidinol-phosphate transaminase [Janibacter corallicola]